MSRARDLLLGKDTSVTVPAVDEQPVQIECEVTVTGPNGETLVSAHTYNMLLPTEDQLKRGIFEAQVGAATLDTGLTGVVGCAARARFRRIT